MQQPQRRFEQIYQICAGNSGRSRVRAFLEVQPRLDQLDVPVAELAPEEIVDAIRRLIETISLKRLVHVFRRAIEPREYPTVFERVSLKPGNAAAYGETGVPPAPRPQARLDPIHVHEHEPRRVPYLVGKITVSRGAALAERDIRAGSCHRRQGEARRVRPVLPDHLNWIKHIALSLRHFLPIRIAHQGVDVNLAKGNARTQGIFARRQTRLRTPARPVRRHHEPAPEHDHPCHPEKQDVEAGNHQ